jgi:hypothetical protein
MGKMGSFCFFCHRSTEKYREQNGFVLFFCILSFLYSSFLCLVFSYVLAAPDRATLFSFGRDFSPAPFLIIRTYAEQVKENSKIRAKILDGINRIYRINELKNSRTQGLKKWNFAVLNMFYHEVQEEDKIIK